MSNRRSTWQLGGLQDLLGGVRVVVEFEHDDEPPADADLAEWYMDHERKLVDVRAETVIAKWLFWRSLLVRDAGIVVRGALRMGDLEWSPLAGSIDLGALDLEQARAALNGQGGRDQPTDRERRAASKKLDRAEIRACLEHGLTMPEVGAKCFRRWGRQFERWEIAAGPLSPRGRPRQGDARRRNGERDADVADRLWLEFGTPAKRRYRDGARALPTDPLPVVLDSCP